SSDWQVVLASLRDRRDYTEGSATQILERWNQTLTPELRTRIFSPNYLCRVPQELVRLAYEGRALFNEAHATFAADLDDPAARGKRLAAAALPLFDRDHAAELNIVRANLQLRFDVVRYLTDVRRFAKMDAFV